MTDNTHSSTDRRIDRRTLLGSLSGACVGLAGCLSIPFATDESSADSSPKSDVFETVEMIGTELVIELASDTAADSVNFVGPDGESHSVRQIRPGTTRVTIQLLGETEEGYKPGEYRVIASNGNESLGETTVLLEPELAISDLKWAKNNPDMDWDKTESTWQDHAALEIENTGTGPSYLEAIQWTDAPLCRVKGRDTMKFYHNVILPAGETTMVYSLASIYRTEAQSHGRNLDCGELDSGKLTVTVIANSGENPSYSQVVEYGGEMYNCDLLLTDGHSSTSLIGGDV